LASRIASRNETGLVSAVLITVNVTLNGNGKINLSNNASNLITGTCGSTLTSANTVQGSGNIANALISMVNTGTISANQSTALIVDTNSTLTGGTYLISSHRHDRY
jgi:hypothetical protein